jgi:hypothetical protein
MTTMSERKRVPGSAWFRVGAWLSVLTAIGHTLGNHTSLAPRPTPQLQQVMDAMRQVILPITGKSFWRGFIGDSLSLSLFLAGFGLVNLLFERHLRQHGETVPLSVLTVDIVVTVGSIVIAAACFPPQPLVGGLVALAAYGVALIQVLGRAGSEAVTRDAAKIQRSGV